MSLACMPSCAAPAAAAAVARHRGPAAASFIVDRNAALCECADDHPFGDARSSLFLGVISGGMIWVVTA